MVSFVMADLPEREQADMSFDTLYHLAKKLQVRHQPCSTMKGGALTHEPYKGYKKYSAPGGRAATVEVELFPPDPELVESAPLEPDHLEGLSPRMTQAMKHYQREEHRCFVCGDTGHFVWDCPHHETFHTWHKQHLNSLGVSQKNRMPIPKIEGCGLLALADSGSQVNTMMPEFLQVQGYPVLPLDKLVDYPLHLVGPGSQHTCPLGFVIAKLQVKEVAGYDEDVVFLVVPDELSFSRRVPLVIGTCMIGCIINVIKESELD